MIKIITSIIKKEEKLLLNKRKKILRKEIWRTFVPSK